MRTTVITGAASGMGASTRARLVAAGQRVIGVDRVAADGVDVTADLGTPEGRAGAVAAIGDRCDGSLDGLVTFAGIAGLPNRSAAMLVSINYFGSVALLSALRPLLANGTQPAAIAISSNSTTTQPGVPVELVDMCLQDDEEGARALALTYGELGSLMAYPATKTAIARWVRRHAPRPEWIGAGITLNAVAPGYIVSPMTDEGRNNPLIGPMLDQFVVPAGYGRPDDVSAFVAYLLGPDARYFCGSVLFIDGGTDALTRPDDWPTPLVAPDPFA